MMWNLILKNFPQNLMKQIKLLLRFENNFLAKKTKNLEAGLFQVKAQLERTSSAKLNEMLSVEPSWFKA